MPMPLPSRSNSTTRLELGASTGTPRHCSVHQQPATQIRQALKNVLHFLTRDNEPTIGSCRTRTDRPVTVTSAPLFNTSAFFAQTPCKSTARAVALRPSFRIRIADGLRAPLVASKEWKSASSVTHTRDSARARWVMSASSARLMPISDTCITSHQACLNRSSRPRHTLIKQDAIHADSNGCTL